MPKERKMKISITNLVFVIAVVFLLGMMTGTYVYQKKFSAMESNNNGEVMDDIKAIDGEHVTQTMLPAVDSEGTGVAGILLTRVRPGSGLVLVNVNDVLAQADTQLSGRIAAQIAGKYMNMSMKNYDVIYSIEVNATVVEGPSAGAAMAVTIIGALQNKTLNSSVMITGTIE
ncbi:MAG: S16 family serine protease, partial [Candidatus Aenigmatarchaeota archaeon]